MSDSRRSTAEEEILARQREIAARLQVPSKSSHIAVHVAPIDQQVDAVKPNSKSEVHQKKSDKSRSIFEHRKDGSFDSNRLAAVKNSTLTPSVIDLTTPTPKKAKLKRKEQDDVQEEGVSLKTRHDPPSPKRLKSDSSSDVAASLSDMASLMNPMSALKRAPIRKKVVPIIDSDDCHWVADNNNNNNQKKKMTSSSSLIHTSSTTIALHRKPAPPTPLYYPQIEYEDFWRDVRNWDFLFDLNTLMHPIPQNKSKVKNNQELQQQEFKSSSLNLKMAHAPTIQENGEEEEDNAFIMTRSGVPDSSVQPWTVQRDLNYPNDKNVIGIPMTIPTTFQSARQYKAIWAPHCCSESRAQLLSDFAADIGYWKTCDKSIVMPGQNRGINTYPSSNKKRHHNSSNNNGKSQGPIRVKVSTLKRDVGTHTDYITIKVEAIATEPETDISFMPNDIVLLTYNLSCLALAAQGKFIDSTMNKDITITSLDQRPDSKSSVQCILGHCEFSRRSIDGLQLKVSRKRWLQFSTSNDKTPIPPPLNSDILFLVKLGANITALREFTALSRLDSMPLLPFILNIQPNNKSTSDSRNQHPRELLASMGGSEALGKGFVTYLERKYNSSQIAAIAAAAREYGDGGFTLIKGPPGTGKTTTLVALLNSLHIRQFNKYFEGVRKIVLNNNYVTPGAKKLALAVAAKDKPRILVCAPSNTAVDNIILKIMEHGFVDGSGSRYNPTMIRVGSGQSASVQAVSLESKVNDYLSSRKSPAKFDAEIASNKSELNRIQCEIFRLRKRIDAILNAAPWELSKDWEIRVDENFEENNRVVFVNHKEKSATYECPPPPEPNERHFPATAMPEYRSFMSTMVKMVDRYSSVQNDLERCHIVQRSFECDGKNNSAMMDGIRNDLETHVLDSVHIVLTTLGTAGSKALESAAKFEVVVIDEAAQSVEPSSLTALQLGSKHCILVGDPQQLPATIFSVSGKSTKYDRSLFQRLEDAGHRVYMLQVQYRMHPKISHFPRHIFYGGSLLDGPNVEHAEYGHPLRRTICTRFPSFEPFTIFDLESLEERDGTSMSNRMEADFVLHLYKTLQKCGVQLPRLAIITPYAQQATLIRRIFSDYLKDRFESMVEVNTVDAFQGRESDIVIFSAVRASGCKSIGFLSDVRRMNVALTRAKFFLFVVARCKTISMNPYWKDLVQHAKESNAVIRIPSTKDFPSFEKREHSSTHSAVGKKQQHGKTVT